MTNRPTPRIQVSLGPFWAFELEHAMDLVAEAGYTDIELMVTRDPMTQQPGTPLRLANERGLNIASVHGPFLFVTKSVWGLDPVEKINRGVDMCTEVGARTLIVHPPFLWEQDYARWVAGQTEVCEQATGVTVAVETMYPKWVAGRRLRAYRWLKPDELAQAAPRTVLDTSHLSVARLDILDAYSVLKDGLVHIHLSNNAGDGRDGHLELANGVLPIERFLKELRRTQYDQVISLELSVTRYLKRSRQLVEMLKRNREYVEDRLTHSKVAKGLPRR